MNSMVYLFLAYALVWAGTLIYLYRIAGLRKHLEKRVDALEGLAASDDHETV